MSINKSESAVRDLTHLDDKLKECSAHRKLNMLKGVEGYWISMRRNNICYAINKVISFVLSIGFAVLTLYLKY